MKQYNIKLTLLGLMVLFVSCSKIDRTDENSDVDETQELVSVERKFDSDSETFYYLTRIKHKDHNNKILKLEHQHSIKTTGETVLEFSKRMNDPAVAINASTMHRLEPPGTIKPNGVQIINGEIIQDRVSTAYTLGIKENGGLVAYKPEIRAEEIIKAGIVNALTGFMPLIEGGVPVSDDVLSIRENSFDRHPRQVIAQFENLDLLILSCGGRGFQGEGMLAKDLIRILEELKVEFAYNLDGGGSVSTVVGGKRITPQIDGDGTKDRLRPNFLYVQ